MRQTDAWFIRFNHMPKQPDTLSRYKDPTGTLGSTALKRGVWFVKHKVFFYKLTVVTLSIVCAVTVSISAFLWIRYIAFDYWNDQDDAIRRIQSAPNYAAAQPLYEASPLSFGRLEVSKSAQDQYDFIIDVKNPNTQFLADVVYRVSFADGVSRNERVMLMPGAQHPIGLFGVVSASFPARPEIELVSVAWQRISPHDIRDPAGFLEDRLQMVPSTFTYEAAGSAGVTLARVTFDLTNESIYSYWEPQFILELLRGGSRVGITVFSLDSIRAGEVVPIDLRLSLDTTSVSSIRLHPLVNVFDADIYIPIGE
jgi:hypothetical protein